MSRELVRCPPPIDTVYWCRDCQSTDGVVEGSEECIDCDAVDEPGRPVVQSGAGPELPIRTNGAGPRGCVSCGTVWVTATSHVVWYFEGGLSGAACPTCARSDAASSMWQQVTDLFDGIDALMQVTAPSERDAIVGLIIQRANWFRHWRDDADGLTAS